jgi:hypothetical protein
MSKVDPEARLSKALEKVKLYTELNLRLLPGEPTESQCWAGADAGRVSPDLARIIYLAMIEADEADNYSQ